MAADPDDGAYLWDMREAASAALGYVAGLSEAEVLADPMRLDAIERRMEVLGEAARHVSPAFVEAHPEIPWRSIIGLRNVLAHEYGRIDQRRLVQTVVRDVPALLEQLAALSPLLDE